MNLFMPNLLPILFMMMLIGLCFHRTHLLMALLFLEAGALILTMMILTLCKSSFMVLILLTFGACEAALGLSCLVKLTSQFGSDNIKSMSLSKC